MSEWRMVGLRSNAIAVKRAPVFPSTLLTSEPENVSLGDKLRGRLITRPTILFATVFFGVQALRNLFCSFLVAGFSDRFSVVFYDFLLLCLNWKVFGVY